MALQASGQIKMSEINTELGRPSNSANTSLDSAENGSYGTINDNSTSRPNATNPARMSEWYSYKHTSFQVQVMGNNGGSFEAAEIYYKIGAGAWTLLGSANLSGSYASIGSAIFVTNSSTVYFGVKKNGDVDNVSFGAGNGGAFTGYCGKNTTPSYSVLGKQTYYLNVDCFNGGLQTC